MNCLQKFYCIKSMLPQRFYFFKENSFIKKIGEQSQNKKTKQSYKSLSNKVYLQKLNFETLVLAPAMILWR